MTSPNSNRHDSQARLGGFVDDDQSPTDRIDLERAYLELSEELLPDQAAEQGDWPIRFDHCFQRVALDLVAGTEWYHEIADPDADVPAYRQLDDHHLRHAVDVLFAMHQEGKETVEWLNSVSLRYRDEI